MMAKEAPCMAEITAAAAAGVAIPGGDDDDITLLAASSASDGGGEKVQTTSPSSSQRPATDTAASPDVQTRQRERNRRKDDPLHKFRVAAPADGASGSGSGGAGGGGGSGSSGGVKRRSSSFNGRNSRREVLYPKSNQPASVWDARFGRGAASDEDRLLSSTAKKMQARRSPRESSSDLVHNFAIGGRGGDNNPWAGVWGAKETTNCSECSAAQAPSAASASPRQDSSSKFNSSESADAADERQTLPSVLRRVRSSRSTRRWTTTTETSRATTPEWSSPAQGGGGHSPTVRFSEDSPQPILRSTPPRSPALDRRRTSAGAEGFVLPSKAKALAALAPATPDASGGTTPEGMSRRCCPEGCNSSSAAASSSSPGPIFREPSSSTGIRECRSCGRGLLPSSTTESSQPQPNPRSSPLIGSLRHKFSMEATEIRDPTTKPWARSGAKSGKAVMFSNPAYVPSPSGNDGGIGKSDSPTATTTAPAVNSPGATSSPGSRSPSATRRVMNRIGRALSAGRRSISPDLTQRLNSTCHKLISLSPGKNLPSIFPSRAAGRKSSSAPRASFVKSSSCMKAASDISESSEAAPSRRGGSGSGSKSQPLGCSNRDSMMPRTVARDGDVSFAAATHNSSNCDYVITQPSNGEIMQDVFNYGDGAAGGPVPNISTMATPEANLKRSSSSSDTSPEAVREISTRPGRGTSPTDDLVAVRSEAQWEYGSHADVLSSCREWVEKSSPPLPAGLTVVDMNGDAKAVKFPEEELGAREVVELEEDGRRQVVGCSPLSAAAVDETVLGRPAADHATQQQRQEQQRQGQEQQQQQQQPAANLKKSWSGGSRSSSTGKARQVPGSALLKRAKCWMKTQTPQRERPRQAVEVYAL